MFFSCICVWKTVYQHYSSSFVDTLLSTALHPSFHQMLAFALLLSAVVESYQIKFSLPEDNQVKLIPYDITIKNYFPCIAMCFVKIQLNSQGSG